MFSNILYISNVIIIFAKETHEYKQFNLIKMKTKHLQINSAIAFTVAAYLITVLTIVIF